MNQKKKIFRTARLVVSTFFIALLFSTCQQFFEDTNKIRLVCEMNIHEFLLNNTRVKNAELEELLHDIKARVNSKSDFLDILQVVFEEEKVPLNRYFGTNKSSDSDIISGLRVKVDNAMERTVQALKNRVDQFGNPLSSVTRDGAQRLVVELAGVKNVERAKNIITTTGLLKFQLEKEPEGLQTALDSINYIVEKGIGQKTTNKINEIIADGAPHIKNLTDLHLNDIFGDCLVSDSADIATPRPFDALMANYMGDIVVPGKYVATVASILLIPQVQQALPEDSEFLFTSKPITVGGQKYQRLFFVKKEPELTSLLIADATVKIESDQYLLGVEFTSHGSKIFSEVTGTNIGKRMMITLDGRIVSFPNILQRIPSGRAQLTGFEKKNEAIDLAIVLRGGALPVPITIISETILEK